MNTITRPAPKGLKAPPYLEVGHAIHPGSSNLVYEATTSLDQQLSSLHALLEQNRAAEHLKRTRPSAGAIGCVAVLAAFVVGPAVHLLIGLDSLVGQLAFGVGLLLWLGLFLGWKSMSTAPGTSTRDDLDDRKLHAAMYPLWALRSEVKPGSVTVALNFRPIDREEPADHSTERRGPKTLERTQFVQNGWLRLAFALLDGTRVKINCSTRVGRRLKFKRTRRGVRRNEHQLMTELVDIVLTAAPEKELNPHCHDALLDPLMMMPIPTPRIRVGPTSVRLRYVAPPITARRPGIWVGEGPGHLTNGYDLVRLLQASYRAFAERGLKQA